MSRITINSNIASVNALRRLSANSTQLYSSYERLSSGLRINHAKDDAAGLAISSLLDVDRRVGVQGIRNINDGASLLNIAEGALTELGNILVRMRELSEQAANGTLGYKQRAALDEEAQALSDEYSRVAHSTTFNGINLLGGGIDTLRIQAGYGTDAIVSRLGGAIASGTFRSGTGFDMGATTTGPSFFDDLNFDGVNDVIQLDNAVNVLVRLGNADGSSFAINQTFVVGAGARNPRIADFNNDGFADMLNSETTNDTLIFHFGNSDGSFTAGRSSAIGTGAASTPIAADFNLDGNIDLAITDTTADVTLIRMGNADGTFTIKYSMVNTAGTTAVTFNDVNGDDYVDALITDQTEGTVSIALANGDGSFKARVSNQGVVNLISFGASSDVNGDGLNDLFTMEAANNSVSAYFGNGDGTFRARVSFQTGIGPASLSRIDINDDGILDLTIKETTDSTLSFMLGNGDGTFKARTTMATAAGVAGLTAFRDVSGDGVNDIVSYNSTDHTLYTYVANTVSGVASLPVVDLSTRNGALRAMPLLEQSQTRLISQRGVMGAFQSRLQTALNTASVSTENFAAARSRIVDADIAEESAGLVKNRILQQAAAAVLAQANKGPELALRLLEGLG